ncbi:MAG: hypothetical protein Q8L85_03435 [Alphaproteobacteria bacterium]|nr:hypothetical protein [Alphaproteobacteria bacterium]
MSTKYIFNFSSLKCSSKALCIVMVSLLLTASMMPSAVNASQVQNVDIAPLALENDALAHAKEFIIKEASLRDMHAKELNEAFGILLKHKENNDIDENLITKIWNNKITFSNSNQNLLNYFLYLYKKNFLYHKPRIGKILPQFQQFLDSYLDDIKNIDTIKIFLERKNDIYNLSESKYENFADIIILKTIFNKFYDTNNNNKNLKNEAIDLIFKNTIYKKNPFECFDFFTILDEKMKSNEISKSLFYKLFFISNTYLKENHFNTFSLDQLGGMKNTLNQTAKIYTELKIINTEIYNSLFNDHLVNTWLKSKISEQLNKIIEPVVLYKNYQDFFEFAVIPQKDSFSFDSTFISEIISQFIKSYKNENQDLFLKSLNQGLLYNFSFLTEPEMFLLSNETIYRSIYSALQDLLKKGIIFANNTNAYRFVHKSNLLLSYTKSVRETSSDELASNLFDATYENFYKYLRSKTNNKDIQYSNDFLPFNAPLIISHQGVYNEGIQINVPFENGNPLYVEYPLDGKTYPIGYTIYFPEDTNHIEAIQVQVYGGLTKEERIKNAYRPSSLYNHEAYLARHNTMIIKLNLPDFLGDTHQRQMTEETMNMLQYCIQHFWKALNNNPESIDNRLLSFKNVPKYLSGGSFGGFVSLLQAQNYPNTWDGYISHNGWLSIGKNEKWDILNRKYILQPNPNKIEDPFLVLGNAHDNNVNMRDWTNFYKKMKKEKKEHLVKSWFTYSGISLGKQAGLEGLSNDLTNTGHYAPNNIKELLTYSKVILDFMKKDEIVHENILSDHINLIGWIKSYENDISATAEKLFLAEVYEQEYEKNNSIDEEALKNIFLTFYLLKNDPSSLGYIIRRKSINDQLRKGLERDYEAWVYFTQDFMQHDQAYPISRYFEPSLNMNFSNNLLESYKECLLKLSTYYGQRSDKRESLAFLRSMRSFFVENPELVRDFDERYKVDQDFQKAFEKAKEKWNKIKTEIDEVGHKLIHSSPPKDKDELLHEIDLKNDNIISLEEISKIEGDEADNT